jgi:hypothetical protein
MGQATTAAMPEALGRSRRQPGLRLATAVAGLRKVLSGLFDRYRPELHYMRGPGPKWHEKHDGPSTA